MRGRKRAASMNFVVLGGAKGDHQHCRQGEVECEEKACPHCLQYKFTPAGSSRTICLPSTFNPDHDDGRVTSTHHSLGFEGVQFAVRSLASHEHVSGVSPVYIFPSLGIPKKLRGQDSTSPINLLARISSMAARTLRIGQLPFRDHCTISLTPFRTDTG